MKANIGDMVILECEEDEVFIISKSLHGGLKIETALYWAQGTRPDVMIGNDLHIIHKGQQPEKMDKEH